MPKAELNGKQKWSDAEENNSKERDCFVTFNKRSALNSILSTSTMRQPSYHQSRLSLAAVPNLISGTLKLDAPYPPTNTLYAPSFVYYFKLI